MEKKYHMSVIIAKKLYNSRIVKFSTKMAKKIYNNRIVNVATSTVGMVFTSYQGTKDLFKGAACPIPLCKVLYFTSASLHGVSCATSGVCLLGGHSSKAPLPIRPGTFAFMTSLAAKGCGSLADYMDPSSKITNACIDSMLKKLSGSQLFKF
jgi:hypothetical protein